MEKVSRRDFIEKTLEIIGITFLLSKIPGCVIDAGNNPSEILLTEDPRINAETVFSIQKRIKQVIEDPLGKDELRIGLIDIDGAVGVVALSYKRNDEGEKRVVLVDEKTGKSSFLEFGIKGALPSIRFTDKKGKTLLNEDGEAMEYSLLDFNKLGAPTRSLNATDWLVLAIKAVAVGFAIWLGAKIAILIVGAVAFIAFNAMILGLVIAGVAVLGLFFKKVGWDYDTVVNFFGKTVEDIKVMFQDVALGFGG